MSKNTPVKTDTSNNESTDNATDNATDEAPERTPLAIIAEEFEGAPSVETMISWKAQYGALHAFAPDEDVVYLFRPLRRLEHKNMTRDIRQLAESNSAQANPAIVEDALHEKVIQSCVLHPAVGIETLTNN